MNKVKASALYFVLIISLLLHVILGLFVIFSKFHGQLAKNLEIQSRLYENANTTIQLFSYDSAFRASVNDSLCLDLFGHGKDSVCIIVSPWGFWDLVGIKSHYGRFRLNEHYYFANKFPASDTMASTLYLCDQQNMLVLAGDSKLSGICYLPAAGLKPGVLNGKPYSRKDLIEGNQLISKPHLPKIDSNILKNVRSFLDTAHLKAKYPIYGTTIIDAYTLKQSFHVNTALFFLRGKQVFSSVRLQGNILIYCDEEVVIGRNSVLNDVIIVAPIIKIDSGFRGNLQAFSTDSIVVHENVELTYPSVLFNYISNEKDGKVIVMQDVKIDGALISMDERKDDKNARVEIHQGALIKGLVWVEGYLQVNADIDGHLFTNKFIWNTTASIYENYLLDTELNANKLSTGFLFPTIYPSKHKNILKKLQ